jgi:hypothetical protein
MTDKNNGSFSTVLVDVDPDHRGSLPVRVIANESAVSFFPEGYGDFGSAEGRAALRRLVLPAVAVIVVAAPAIDRRPQSFSTDASEQVMRGNDHDAFWITQCVAHHICEISSVWQP